MCIVINYFKCEVLNANGIVYPKEVVEKSIERFLRKQKNNVSCRMLGSLEHQSKISIQINNTRQYGLQQTV